MAHHGSETSRTLEFIEVVTPEVVVIQFGQRVYGGRTLPDETVRDCYCALSVDTQIYRTDQDDATDGLTAANDEDGDHVVIRTNGTTIEVEALEGGEVFQVAVADDAVAWACYADNSTRRSIPEPTRCLTASTTTATARWTRASSTTVFKGLVSTTFRPRDVPPSTSASTSL